MEILIQDLLEFSRVDRKGEPFQRVDFHAVVNDALLLLSTAIEESQTQVQVDQLPSLVVDRGQFVRVMQNLIGNAIKFRGPEPPRVHVDATRDGRAWHFSVRDNGVGIEPAHREEIFGVFKRLTSDAIPGTGVGLALCKQAVDKHGGRIWADAAPGGGTSFHFTIPGGP
jgi:light-regulated signal transduction histidine kinase (bacteriophytochrome)